MSKIVSTKVNAVFLAAMLIAGTIALSIPSFMTNAQAQQNYYYGGSGMENTYNNNEYEKYSKYFESSKDSSSKIVKKVSCNNINVNVNGLELNGLPPSLTNLLIDGEADNEGKSGASSYGSGEQSGYYNNNFKFVCINNNNNTVVVVNETTPEPTPEPLEPLTCVECFREFLTPSEIAAFEGFTQFTIEEWCLRLDANPITASGFGFALETITGAEPIEINNLVECLIESGIEFLPGPPPP